jgi:hypothetical protein
MFNQLEVAFPAWKVGNVFPIPLGSISNATGWITAILGSKAQKV